MKSIVASSPSIDTRTAIKNAAFLVVPSVWYEGFPMVMTESLACGTPVVGSRLGAIEEIIDDGRTGLLFSPGASTDLADKIEWAWSHPAELTEMGRQARRDYEDLYSAEKNYSLLMGIYRRAIEENAFPLMANSFGDPQRSP